MRNTTKPGYRRVGIFTRYDVWQSRFEAGRDWDRLFVWVGTRIFYIEKPNWLRKFIANH